VAVLLTIPSTAVPVGTQTFGPFSFTQGMSILARLTPTVWPAAGLVLTIQIIMNTGEVDQATFNGQALPFAFGGAIGPGVQNFPAGSSVTVKLITAQAFTASGLVSSV
jgi:hypothetical protein